MDSRRPPPASLEGCSSAVHLAHDRIQRTQNGDGVAQEVARKQIRNHAERMQAGRSDLQPVGIDPFVSARDEVGAEFASRALYRAVGLTFFDLDRRRPGDGLQRTDGPLGYSLE